MLVVYVINAAIAYLSYLEAKRVGQVSLLAVAVAARLRFVVSFFGDDTYSSTVHTSGLRCVCVFGDPVIDSDIRK